MIESIAKILTETGLSPVYADIMAKVTLLALIILCAALVYFLIKLPITSLLKKAAQKTNTYWDDIIIERRVINRLAHFFPGLVIYLGLPNVLDEGSTLLIMAQRIMLVYLTFMGVLFFNAVLNSLLDIAARINASWQIPFRMFAHIIKLFLYFSACVLVIAIITNKSPLVFFSGLGAFTAILMLVFKDSILGFVAGIQIAMNDMLAHGDWIEMPQYGADGTVVEIALTTIKIQNWDMTISTVPTYALISDSFKNWRGMEKANGRRIKRSINIDLHSIKFCTEDMLVRFADISLISDFIASRQDEIKQHNEAIDNPSQTINARRMTNIGIFRIYIERYLKQHPMSHDEMTLLVRQLSPTKHGLPIEVYFFSKQKAWVEYEAIQSDIFDHLLAIAAEFDLSVFQLPSGADLQSLQPPING